MPEEDGHRENPRAAVPVMAAVFLFFASVGITLPVLPLHVHHDRLGDGPLVIGLVAGCQFATALISRFWAGRLADRDGPRRAVAMGLCAAMAGSACYLASLALLGRPVWSVVVLLVGRALLGGKHSCRRLFSKSWRT